MSAEEQKIVTPTPEETARYAGRLGAGGQNADAGAPTEEETTAQVKSEAEQWKEKFLRSKADLANYQKRVEKERVENMRYACGELVKALLPTIDDLDRLIASGAEGKADAASFVEGAKLLRENLLKALGQFNVTQIQAQDQPFDPEIHQAILETPSAEHTERTVVQEVAKGYKLHDRVLRPARVVVARPADVDAGSAAEEDKDADV